MATQKIDPAALSTASKALANGHSQITSQLETVSKAVQNLMSSWEGQTQQAFNTFYTDYKKAMTQSLTSLTDMSNFITKYSANAEELDAKHASALN
jgi:WXG100 family type VII secretion target